MKNSLIEFNAYGETSPIDIIIKKTPKHSVIIKSTIKCDFSKLKWEINKVFMKIILKQNYKS